MASANSANLKRVSYLIKYQIPEFVREDHPQFVRFLEQYYEHLQTANTEIYDSVSNNYFIGSSYFIKDALDNADIDTTDFNKFLANFRRELAPNFPIQLNTSIDAATFYKNVLAFYRAKGTEDSFKLLFRLLYGEEIELYYPNRDILTLSGGTFSPEVRVRLETVNNIEDIVGRIVYGANSGIYATVERIERSYDKVHYPWRDPADRGDSTTFVYLNKFSVTNTTATQTEFDIGEVIYTGNVSGDHVNTVIQASPTTTVFYDDFSTYGNVNYLLTSSDNRGSLTNSITRNTADPLYASGFDESTNVFSSNTGSYNSRWFDWRSMQSSANLSTSIISDQYVNPGITFITDESAAGGRVMVIGNEGNTHAMTSVTSNQNTEDLVELIHTTNITIDSSKLYKFSVRVKDPHHYVNTSARSSTAGGPQTVAGPYFNSGYSALKSDGIAFNDQLGSSYTAGEHWVLSSYLPPGLMSYENAVTSEWGTDAQQSESWTQDWRIFQAYVTGSNAIADVSGFGNSREFSNTTATPVQNVFSYLESPAAFHTDTVYMRPLIQVDQDSGDAANTGGSQVCVDYYKIEEMGTIEPLTDIPHYLNESSRLSTKSAVTQDNVYYQQYAYDIRSNQDFKTYTSVIESAVHPAGFKRYGTKLAENLANVSLESSNNNLSDTFSPDTINALAGWWRADAIGPDNIEWKRWSPGSTSNGIFGTITNRFPAGMSAFEDTVAADLEYIHTDSNLVPNLHFDYSLTEHSPIGGKKSLKIIDRHSSSGANASFGAGAVYPGASPANRSDEVFGLVLEPKKTWLISCYATTSNLTSDVANRNSLKFDLCAANSTGYVQTVSSGWTEPFTEINKWNRLSNTVSLSAIDETRFNFKISLPDRSSRSALSTGNTFYIIDGLMIEEYNAAIHGAAAPFTPSPFVLSGMGGANVVSWYDQSLNEHHVYANTHGGKFYTPQFIANAVNGMPAVRFSANTVKNTANVYQYSSIGGTINPASGTKPPTTALQAKTMLASNALARPVSNTWTIMAVAKTNLFYNSDQYGDTTFAGQEPKVTIFNSGYNGAPYHIEDDSPTPGDSGGSMDLFLDRTGSATRGKIQTHTSNGSAIRNVEGPTFTTNPNTFSIFGISEFAGTGSDANVHFYYNGLRSEIAGWSADTANQNFQNDGIVWDDQIPYVTSIGGWAPSNNKIWDTGTDGVNQRYSYGEHAWDGDIAEIVVFNEKLSNTNIALVEGYLAHKYGLQESLVHKSGAGDHPYRYQAPPAVGANNTSY